MGVKTTGLVLERFPNDRREKFLLVGLAHHANDQTGVAWPSVGRLAAYIGRSRRTAQRYLRELEKTEVISAVGSTSGAGGRSTKYRINIEHLSAMSYLEGVRQPRGREGNLTRAPNTRPRVSPQCHTDGDTEATPQTFKEHIKRTRASNETIQRKR